MTRKYFANLSCTPYGFIFESDHRAGSRKNAEDAEIALRRKHGKYVSDRTRITDIRLATKCDLASC